MTPTRRSFRLALAIPAGLLIAVALVAAGCGGGSSSSAAGTTTTSGATPAASSSGTRAAFAACLKKNGVEGFDPGSAAPGAQGAPPQGVDPAALQKAMQACGNLRPQGQGFGPGQNGQSSAQFAKLQTCLKQHGVKGGFTPGASQSDADRQKLQDAMKACGASAPVGGLPPAAGSGANGGGGSFAAFAQCMKRRGVVLPGTGSGTPTDTSSAKYKAAQKACQPVLDGSGQ
jgi:hypothetical protein